MIDKVEAQITVLTMIFYMVYLLDGAAAGDREKMISRVPLVHDVRDVDFHQPISKKSRLLNLGPPLSPDEEMAESTGSAHAEDSLDYSSDGSSPSSSTCDQKFLTQMFC
jgi:hypothetical protein